MSGSVRLVAVVLALILLLGNPVLAQEAPPITEASEDNETQPVPEPAPAESTPTPPDGASGEDTGVEEDQYNNPSAPADKTGSPLATAVPPGEEEVPPLDSGDTSSCEQYGCDQYNGNVEAPSTGASPEDLPDPNECDQYASCEQYSNPLTPPTDSFGVCATTDGCEFTPPPGLTCEFVFDPYYGQYVYQCANSVDPVQECTTHFEDGYYITECIPSSCVEGHVYDEQGNYLTGSSMCGYTAVAERAAEDYVEVSYSLKQDRSTLIASNNRSASGSRDTDIIGASVNSKSAVPTIAPAGRATSTEGGARVDASSEVEGDQINLFGAETGAREINPAGFDSEEDNEDRDGEDGSQAREWLARLVAALPTASVASFGATNSAEAQNGATVPSTSPEKNDKHSSPTFGMLPLTSSIGVLVLIGSMVLLRKRPR